MRKPYKSSFLSEKVCQGKDCKRKLKMNVIERNPNATHCYDCDCRRKFKKKYRYAKGKQ